MLSRLLITLITSTMQPLSPKTAKKRGQVVTILASKACFSTSVLLVYGHLMLSLLMFSSLEDVFVT